MRKAQAVRDHLTAHRTPLLQIVCASPRSTTALRADHSITFAPVGERRPACCKTQGRAGAFAARKLVGEFFDSRMRIGCTDDNPSRCNRLCTQGGDGGSNKWAQTAQ